jgi:GNAT superfamily N-acetyltransferase
VCDSLEPWEHGTVVRASAYPHYFDLNLVRVEEDPAMSVAELSAFADEALAGLGHRRIDFEVLEAAARRRAQFAAAGWSSTALLWMHRDRGRNMPPVRHDVSEVPYDAVAELRLAWQREGAAELDDSFTAYLAYAREIASAQDVRVFAVLEGGAPVAFAQLCRVGSGAEVTHVYVRAELRGDGRGGAVTSAAIEAAGDVADVWICADDEEEAKRLYARLGFQPALRTMEFQRVL